MAETADRRELPWLLDHIPETGISSAREFLQTLIDPVTLSLLRAPCDDEPQTDAEREAVARARSEPAPGTPHEDVLHEFRR